MIEISIKQNDKKSLVKLFDAHIDGRDKLMGLVGRFQTPSTHHPNTMFAKFSETELEAILDALTERFVSVGLQSDSEPNALGLEIERYIDIFNVSAQE